jgi:hypothetical protein
MPRGPARDTVPPDTAQMVRSAVIKARDEKGLTNYELADHLNWDYRTVTNALQGGRPLRLPNAASILRAITELPPRRDGQNLGRKEAWAIHKEVQGILAPPRAALTNLQRKRWPAALIAARDLNSFAAWITDAIVRRGGFSEKRRRDIAQAIENSLVISAGRFTFAAHQQLMNILVHPKPALSEKSADHVLARLGYHLTGSP